jgi:hypothetical protein
LITATYQNISASLAVGIGPPIASHGTITATIDGVPWISASALALPPSFAIVPPLLPSAPTLFLMGSDASTGEELWLTVPATVGTYAIGRSAASASLISVRALAQWTAGPVTGSGSITLSRMTTAAAAGTFAFTMTPLSLPAPSGPSGATGTRTVADGAFNVTF